MSAAPMFRLYLWPQRLLLLGPSFDTQAHRHHAAQLAVGLDGELKVRGRGESSWRTAPAFYVPPDVEHAFDAGGSACALLYLDPESSECEHACRNLGSDGIRLLHAALPLEALRSLARHGGNGDSASGFCAALLGGAEPPQPRALDPRLRRALDWLDGHLEQGVTLARVARAAAVSESWLSHRFGADIGVPLRRYVLWRRLRLAIEAALHGATLTEGAHAAGFADSAHLTRSFRDMFGVTPSLLFQQREALAVVFCDS